MNDIGISTRKPDPLARARALGPAIAAVVDEIERIQAFPEPLLTKLHESRLFRLLLPRSVGGEQVEPSRATTARSAGTCSSPTARP